MLCSFPIKLIITSRFTPFLCSHLKTETDDIAVDSSTDTTITVTVKKTLLTGKDSNFPKLYYFLNDGIAKSCHYSKDNNMHGTCVIERLVPAKQYTLRLKACSDVICTNLSSRQTVWTLPRSTWPFFTVAAKTIIHSVQPKHLSLVSFEYVVFDLPNSLLIQK